MFYNLESSSELQKALEDICLAFEGKRDQIVYRGEPQRQRVSKKGVKFFELQGGIPARIAVFQSQNGRGHSVIVELGFESRMDTGQEVVVSKMRVRGQTKMAKGKPRVFFFDPYEDGRKRGAFQAKLDMVQKGLVRPIDVFTKEELDNQRKAGNVPTALADKLVGEVIA